MPADDAEARAERYRRELVRLAQLVSDCRDAQREYFRKHHLDKLKKAKAVEARVDASVQWVLLNRSAPGASPAGDIPTGPRPGPTDKQLSLGLEVAPAGPYSPRGPGASS